MQNQLIKEQEEDEEIYEQMACWCETNDREKTKSIADAEALITDLTSSIEELTATSGRLNTEIKNLEKEIAANQHALDKADAMRQKELAEFNAEEKDLLQTIQTLKSAIVVLAKHHGGALLQVSDRQIVEVATILQHGMQKHAVLLDGVLTPSQKKAVKALVQSTEGQSSQYAPQSGEIFGILKQMKESFETNLSDAQKDEAASAKAFQDLKATKEEEIAPAQESLGTKGQELATADEKLAQDKQNV